MYQYTFNKKNYGYPIWYVKNKLNANLKSNELILRNVKN